MPATVASLLSSRALACAALALLVLCTRAWLIQAWGSAVPFWDQWDAEPAKLYLPWLEGRLGWPEFFQPHNEHRPALTHLANLALFIWNDGWNPWTQLLLNAVLHGATAAALLGLFWHALASGGARAAFMAGLALLFTATSGWQNALWGFQSQVYFGNLLAVSALAGLVASEPLRWRWWLGWLAALLALFSTAAGMFVALAAAAILPFAAHGRPRRAAALLALGALVAAGFMLRVDAPHHAVLHARTLDEFWATFSRCLAWPCVNHGGMLLILQAPLAWLALRRWRAHTPLDTAERCAFALGLLALLHAAAIAYGRAAGLPEHRPLSRYQDPLLLGATAQLFALIRLAPPRSLLLVWSGILGVGLMALMTTNLTLHLPYKRAQDRAALTALRHYLTTGDAAAFTASATEKILHPPDAPTVQRTLDDPKLRALLPADLRTNTSQPPPWIIRHAAVLTALAALLFTSALVSLAVRPYFAAHSSRQTATPHLNPAHEDRISDERP